MNSQEELQKNKIASFIKNDAKPGAFVTQLAINEYLKLCFLVHKGGIEEERNKLPIVILKRARIAGYVARIIGMKGASKAIMTLCDRRKNICKAHKMILKGASCTQKNMTLDNLRRLIEQEETLKSCEDSYETFGMTVISRMRQPTYDGKSDIDRPLQSEIEEKIEKIKYLGKNIKKNYKIRY